MPYLRLKNTWMSISLTMLFDSLLMSISLTMLFDSLLMSLHLLTITYVKPLVRSNL